jgi:hypothetical protein
VELLQRFLLIVHRNYDADVGTVVVYRRSLVSWLRLPRTRGWRVDRRLLSAFDPFRSGTPTPPVPSPEPLMIWWLGSSWILRRFFGLVVGHRP